LGAGWLSVDIGELRTSLRLARSVPSIRPPRSPKSALASSDTLSVPWSGIAAPVLIATTPAPTTAVVITAAYRLRGGVGTRRRPRYLPRGCR
jgi:hypothetical protein